MSPLLYLLLGAQDAAAAWPADSDWRALTVGGAALSDPKEDVPRARIDLVGDSTAPAGYWGTDATRLYVRMRLNGDPCSDDKCSSLDLEGWGVLFSTDGADEDFEGVLLVSTGGALLSLRPNDDGGDDWDNDFDLPTYNTIGPLDDGIIRVIEATDSSFTPDEDYFLDVQVPLSELSDLFGSDYSGDLRLALATDRDFGVKDTGDALTDDLAGADNTSPTVLEDVLSDPLPLDVDGDGLLLGQEDALGTDPEDADTDNDGISDGDEFYIFGSDPTECDSDGDGLVDGLEVGLVEGLKDTNTRFCFKADADPKTVTDPAEEDTDGGSVDDGVEDLNLDGAIDTWETDPNDPSDDIDADDDGVPDILEELCGGSDSTDADGDGVPDSEEGRTDTDGDGAPDFCDDDDDGDTIPTAEEGDHNVDTDDDDVPDYLDEDSDNDGADDIDEGTGDDDCDGIRNFQDFNDTDGPCGENGGTDSGGTDTGDKTIYGFTGGSFTGGACSALPMGAAWLPALAAFLAVGRRQRRRRRPRAGLLALLLPGTASAQEVNAQLFQPSLDSYRFSTLDDARVGPQGAGGGMALNYVDDPFVYRYDDDNTEEIELLGRAATADLFAYGNYRRFRLGLDLPLHPVTDGYRIDSDGGTLLGDIALDAKAAILEEGDAPLDLGGSLRLTLPTGNGTAFLGDATSTVTAQVNAARGERIRVAANLGFQYAGNDLDQIFDDLEAGSRLTFGLGVSPSLSERLWASAELSGQRMLSSSGAQGAMPLEGLISVSGRPMDDPRLVTGLGSGVGLTSGLGAPDFRMVASVGWHPAPPQRVTVTEQPGDTAFDYEVVITDGDGLPLEAWMEVRSLSRNYQAGPDGAIRGALPAGVHEVVITADGFRRETRVLQGASDERITLEVVLYQPRVTVGDERLELTEKVFFEVDSDIIKSDSHSLLDEVAQVLRDHPEIRLIEIQGHTDDQGSSGYNKELSQKRADAVRRYLQAEGIAPRRLRATGYGEDYPRREGTSAEDRAINRRVEFVLLQIDPE